MNRKTSTSPQSRPLFCGAKIVSDAVASHAPPSRAGQQIGVALGSVSMLWNAGGLGFTGSPEDLAR